MKRMIIRDDLMSKSEYSNKYNVNRVTLDQMIKDGKVAVERISKTDYIRLEKK